MNNLQKQIFDDIKIEFEENTTLNDKSRKKTNELLEISEAILWFLQKRYTAIKQVQIIQEKFNITIHVDNYRKFLNKHFKNEYDKSKSQFQATKIDFEPKKDTQVKGESKMDTFLKRPLK